jgi:hypothetical protein
MGAVLLRPRPGVGCRALAVLITEAEATSRAARLQVLNFQHLPSF